MICQLKNLDCLTNILGYPSPSTFDTLNNALQMKFSRPNYIKRLSKGITEVVEMLENEKTKSSI